MVKHYIPEVTEVEAVHDENSGVDPYYSSTTPTRNPNNIIPTEEVK